MEVWGGMASPLLSPRPDLGANHSPLKSPGPLTCHSRLCGVPRCPSRWPRLALAIPTLAARAGLAWLPPCPWTLAPTPGPDLSAPDLARPLGAGGGRTPSPRKPRAARGRGPRSRSPRTRGRRWQFSNFGAKRVGRRQMGGPRPLRGVFGPIAPSLSTPRGLRAHFQDGKLRHTGILF